MEREALSLESRHDVVCHQLELIEGWVEDLPITNVADRRALMHQVVDFLQRYVLVDAAWEEQHLFPLLGARATSLKAEHAYIQRWVKELEDLVGELTHLDAIRFRRTTYKLIGLLQPHMRAEETAVAEVRAAIGARSAPREGHVPREIT